MSQMHVMQAYRGVVDDVIGHVRVEFQEEGIDEATLLELQTLWETKLMQSGALGGTTGAPKKEAIEAGTRETQGHAGLAKNAHPSLGDNTANRDGSSGDYPRGSGKRSAEDQAGEGSSQKQPKLEPKQERYHSDEEKSADDSDDVEDDDDGESLTSSEEEAEPETSNLTLAQFDRVHRSKNKYKCSLREGVMNIMGRDYLFSTATGDFDWS